MDGKLKAMTEVKYDCSGCFTNINMVDKINSKVFHLVIKDGNLSSFNGERITSKINERCKITEIENKTGEYLLSYNIRGLLEKTINKNTGEVVTRYEYHYNQLPHRIKKFEENSDTRISYPAGSAQFTDLEIVTDCGGLISYLKQSCS